MPTNTKPAWGGKPVRAPHIEQFVTDRDYARLNIAVSRDLHTRLKIACARQGRSILDVVVELLDSHFPADAVER